MTLIGLSFFVLALCSFFTVHSRPTGKFSYSKYVDICVILSYNLHEATLFLFGMLIEYLPPVML